MFTCGDCADVDCDGKNHPEAQACDEFTQEMYDEPVVHHNESQIAMDEIRILRDDLGELEVEVERLKGFMERAMRAIINEYRDEY